MINRQGLVTVYAKENLEMPYKDLGRTPRGVDCVGHFKILLGKLNYPFDPPNNYARDVLDSSELRNEMEKWFHKLPNRMDFINGDFGMFREGYHPCHIGVLEIDSSGVNWLIHACRRKQKVVRERIGPNLMNKLVSSYRLKEL